MILILVANTEPFTHEKTFNSIMKDVASELVSTCMFVINPNLTKACPVDENGEEVDSFSDEPLPNGRFYLPEDEGTLREDAAELNKRVDHSELSIQNRLFCTNETAFVEDFDIDRASTETEEDVSFTDLPLPDGLFYTNDNALLKDQDVSEISVFSVSQSTSSGEIEVALNEEYEAFTDHVLPHGYFYQETRGVSNISTKDRTQDFEIQIQSIEQSQNDDFYLIETLEITTPLNTPALADKDFQIPLDFFRLALSSKRRRRLVFYEYTLLISALESEKKTL